MVQIWDQSSLNLIFSFFYRFDTFWAFSMWGSRVQSVQKKSYGCDPHIFIFLSVGFEPVLASQAMKKCLMSSEKKYDNLCHLGFFSEYFLKGRKVS